MTRQVVPVRLLRILTVRLRLLIMTGVLMLLSAAWSKTWTSWRIGVRGSGPISVEVVSPPSMGRHHRGTNSTSQRIDSTVHIRLVHVRMIHDSLLLLLLTATTVCCSA
jgi:hypothetical protein